MGGGSTKDEKSESLACIYAIHVYPPFDQTTVVENRNVVVLKLGEVTMKH